MSFQEARIALQWSGLSQTGAREQNEDAWLACPHPQREATLFAVADGLGGHEGGALASRSVLDALQAAFLALPPLGEDLAADTLGLLDAAHAALQHLRESPRPLPPGSDGSTRWPAGSAPDSTLVLLLVEGDVCCHAHLGDSRLYRLRDGVLVALTADHSLAALMGSTLPPRQDADRARLVRTASHAPRSGDVVGPGPLRANDVLLLCTDGLWQALDDRVIQAWHASSDSPAAWLAALDAAVRAQADPQQDNYTALAVTVTPIESPEEPA